MMVSGSADYVGKRKDFVQKFLKPIADELHVTNQADMTSIIGMLGSITVNLTEGEGKYRQPLHLAIRGFSGGEAAVEFQASDDGGSTWVTLYFVAISGIYADHIDLNRGIICLPTWKLRLKLNNEDTSSNQFYYAVSYAWQD